MISQRLKQVILRELQLDDFELRDDMLASEVPGWDSLAHVGILTAVEAEYGIRLRALEVVRLRRVGDLQELVDRKTQA